MVRRAGNELLAANVYKTLRTKILTLEIKPRTRLVEEEISAEMQVGRTPVREALLRLQGEGLVSRKRGWMVEEGDPANVPWIFESRSAIEGFATRVAALRVTDDELAVLGNLAAQMDDLSNLSRQELNSLNHRFHQAIVRASGNPFFIEMFERTQYNYWNLRLPVLFTREQAERWNEQHKDILGALSRHDKDQAEKLARQHVEETFQIVQGALSGF